LEYCKLNLLPTIITSDYYIMIVNSVITLLILCTSLYYTLICYWQVGAGVLWSTAATVSLPELTWSVKSSAITARTVTGERTSAGILSGCGAMYYRYVMCEVHVCVHTRACVSVCLSVYVACLCLVGLSVCACTCTCTWIMYMLVRNFILRYRLLCLPPSQLITLGALWSLVWRRDSIGYFGNRQQMPMRFDV